MAIIRKTGKAPDGHRDETTAVDTIALLAGLVVALLIGLVTRL